MANINLNLYKTPSNEILQHRKQFYGLWKRCDDQTASLLKRLQNQIDCCAFPPMISREYILIDKFMCELDPMARQMFRRVGTWTLVELIEYLTSRNANVTDKGKASSTIQPTIDQNPFTLSAITMKCEAVSD